MTGETVYHKAEGRKGKGSYSFTLVTGGLPPGINFLILRTGNGTSAAKMIVL
jgi:hypothetical protein